MSQVRVFYEDLQKYSLAIFKNAGISDEDAKIIVDNLTISDLRGVTTHGMFHLPKYIARLKAGSIMPVTKLTIIKETESSTLVDGGGGFGHVIGHKAMKMAMAKAKQQGVGITLVHNSNHFGAVASFAMLASREGQIGIAMTNASPTIAPTGGVVPLIGNNPFSISAPAGKYGAPTLDIALSVSNLSKIKQFAEKGLEIPFGWATDREGVVTTDAREAVKGLLLPVGGYKGYGLILMIDIIAGVLSGASFGPAVGNHIQNPSIKASTQNLGHAFIAIDVATFMDIAVFKSKVDGYLDILKSCEKVKGVTEILYPGEKEHQNVAEQSQKGILFEKEVIDELIKTGKEEGVDFELAVHDA